MADTKTDMTGLDDLFAAARQQTAQMPDGLSDRILADGAQVQTGFLTRSRPPETAPGRWVQLRDLLGGWPGIGGLVTAGVAGIWLGLAPPSALPDPAQLIVQTRSDLDVLGTDDLAFALLEDG